MKRIIVALATFALFLMGVAFAPAALADNGPHIQGTGSLQADGCAGCHRAHTAKAAQLLKTSVGALCTTCHQAGTGAATDVMGGVAYSSATGGAPTAGALRGGGFISAALDTTGASRTTKTIPALAAGKAATSSHSWDGTPQTAWGSGTAGAGNAVSLNCTSCHDPHGNGNYRILRPLPNGGTGANVVIADAAVKTYTTTNYWSAQDTSSTGFISNISSWCSTCHTRYAGVSADTNTGDAIFTFRHMTNDNTAGGPNCIQCHVAHGSNANMTGQASAAVTLPDGTAASAGDSRLLRLDNRGTCIMCHNK
jgi:predicted CXXCH cytochrome family protein